MLEGILSPIFDPLLKLPILWVVVIMAFLITVLITAIYKYTTNQSLMKDLKGEMKELQKEMKELRSEPQKMMQVQKKAMQTNMKYMTHSMRSMLFTFIPIILIFGWMNANLAYSPIRPSQEFTTTMSFYENVKGDVELVLPNGIESDGELNKTISDGETKWILKGEEGEYLLEYNIGHKSYTKELTINEEQKYSKPIEQVKDKTVKQISVDNNKIKVLNLFGWKLGWLGTYILLSIIFSIALRKLFKVY
ncbi:DUF106 domain-containing protein [Candidatus Woesearchaeota archaeon]|nr:DUF106 domain-containing protein [Candidatus Woesearchaeota archaeon]